MLELSELWFILIAVLFIGFVFLEGFDFGVGMQLKFLANPRRYGVVIISPSWVRTTGVERRATVRSSEVRAFIESGKAREGFLRSEALLG